MTLGRRRILAWASAGAIGPASDRTVANRPPTGTDVANNSDASNLLVKSTGSRVARTLGDRAADEISILDFGAPANGTGDDYPAYCAARDSRPAGAVVRIRMPARSYRLSRTPDENNRRVVFLVDDGASFIGEHRPYGSRVVIGRGSQRNRYMIGQADKHQFVGDADSVHNIGEAAGYGYRFEYISDAVTGGGGDVAQASVGQWNKLDKSGAGFGMWHIFASPKETPNARWMMVAGEFNVINRGADQGWSPRRDIQKTMVGIHQYGPMQESYAGPIGRNILFAQCFFGMHQARTYNIQLVEANAIAPAGYYAYVHGSTESDIATWPAAAIAITESWRDGFRADQAKIDSGAAYSLGPGQSVAYRDARGTIVARDMAGPGSPEGVVAAPPGSTWRRTDPADGGRFFVKESGDDSKGWVAK